MRCPSSPLRQRNKPIGVVTLMGLCVFLGELASYPICSRIAPPVCCVALGSPCADERASTQVDVRLKEARPRSSQTGSLVIFALICHNRPAVAVS